MAQPFSRTTAVLRRRSARRTAIGVASATALAASWLAWLFLARVTVTVPAAQAPVEGRPLHASSPPEPGAHRKVQAERVSPWELVLRASGRDGR